MFNHQLVNSMPSNFGEFAINYIFGRLSSSSLLLVNSPQSVQIALLFDLPHFFLLTVVFNQPRFGRILLSTICFERFLTPVTIVFLAQRRHRRHVCSSKFASSFSHDRPSIAIFHSRTQATSRLLSVRRHLCVFTVNCRSLAIPCYFRRHLGLVSHFTPNFYLKQIAKSMLGPPFLPPKYLYK
jgi:hypothetical protein